MSTYTDKLKEHMDSIMPKDIKEAVSKLNANLYNGPSAGEWSQSLIDKVRDYVDGFNTLYYSLICGDFTESMESDFPEDYVEFSSGDIAMAVCGKELMGYVW